MLLTTSRHRKTEMTGFGVILISWYAYSLSENWPTRQIIDSWSCVEVYCQESDFDHHIVTACVNYLEAMPWEKAEEEEEILKIIPRMGSKRNQFCPISKQSIQQLSDIKFAISLSPSTMNDLETPAQEQHVYKLKEDDDCPLLTVDEEVVEMAAKVLEAIGYGIVILPTAKRLHLVKVWHPFVRVTEALIDSATTNVEDDQELTIDSELWQSLDPHLFQWFFRCHQETRQSLSYWVELVL
ncbi:hypothetical protein NC651_035310 [Populus alba x Populus x berolinensis]|nr:hypothetical protein NC651_035310 [Populus alba x Populus x berolinensis]